MRLTGHNAGLGVASQASAWRCGSTAGSAAAVPDLHAYREAVADLLTEIPDDAGAANPGRAEMILAKRIDEPEFAAILSATPHGMDETVERLLRDIRMLGWGSRSSAADLTSLIRICLFAQIEVMWWGQVPMFGTDSDALHSADLVDLEALRRRGLLRFRYRRQAETLVARATRAAQRRLRPGGTPRTAGLRLARTRREVVTLLNQLSRAFGRAAPAGTPPLWVTSLARSVEHQHRLRDLGYAALLPSSHCAGWATDIEMSWFRRFGAHRALQSLLLERQQAGVINVIDEGQAWHACISPAGAGGLWDDFDAEVGG